MKFPTEFLPWIGSKNFSSLLAAGLRDTYHNSVMVVFSASGIDMPALSSELELAAENLKENWPEVKSIENNLHRLDLAFEIYFFLLAALEDVIRVKYRKSSEENSSNQLKELSQQLREESASLLAHSLTAAGGIGSAGAGSSSLLDFQGQMEEFGERIAAILQNLKSFLAEKAGGSSQEELKQELEDRMTSALSWDENTGSQELIKRYRENFYRLAGDVSKEFSGKFEASLCNRVMKRLMRDSLKENFAAYEDRLQAEDLLEKAIKFDIETAKADFESSGKISFAAEKSLKLFHTKFEKALNRNLAGFTGSPEGRDYFDSADRQDLIVLQILLAASLQCGDMSKFVNRICRF